MPRHRAIVERCCPGDRQLSDSYFFFFSEYSAAPQAQPDPVNDAFWGAVVHWNPYLELLLSRTKDEPFGQGGHLRCFCQALTADETAEVVRAPNNVSQHPDGTLS